MSGGRRRLCKKIPLLNAVILSCQAVMEYAQRYAALAEKMAAECSDPVRRNELEVIALNCSHVPARGAGSFMRHVSPSGLFSSLFSWNPAVIPSLRGVLTSICILIIKGILIMEISPESLRRS